MVPLCRVSCLAQQSSTGRAPKPARNLPSLAAGILWNAAFLPLYLPLPVTADPKILHFVKDAPIFFQPWWLDAVAPGAWAYAVARRGEEVAGVLPYAFKIRLGFFRLVGTPTFTPYLGPWLRASTAKYANRLGEEKDLTLELIQALPRFAAFYQTFHPSITNWLPFCWSGFEQTTLYTYRIEDTADLKKLWSETRDNVRTDIKKAQKLVQVRETDDVGEFLPLHRLTFSRQNKALPHSEAVLRRLDAACAERGARKILVAAGPDGRLHAGIYLVTDARAVYYLLSGGDPELRNSGATSLLIWEAIRWASEQGKAFDFEGSTVEPIERFVRSFGGRQTPFFVIKKTPSVILRLYRSLIRLTQTVRAK